MLGEVEMDTGEEAEAGGAANFESDDDAVHAWVGWWLVVGGGGGVASCWSCGGGGEKSSGALGDPATSWGSLDYDISLSLLPRL